MLKANASWLVPARAAFNACPDWVKTTRVNFLASGNAAQASSDPQGSPPNIHSDAHRAMAPSGIRAALEIKHVIRQVAADLEQQRDHQRGQRRERAKYPVVDRQRASCCDPSRCGRQGARPDGQPPDLEPVGKFIFRSHIRISPL